MNKKELFLSIFKKAEAKYGKSRYRLAGDSWPEDWQTLITTIMSAQSRDETTIPIAENLFKKYSSLQKLSQAHYGDVLYILKSMNYNRTKAKHIIAATHYIITHFNSTIPNTIEQLIEIPGVGRKTANLVLSEVHGKDSITIDTHCHRILNVLGIVKTKSPYETEKAMIKIAPKRYWSRINRIFVFWGKDVPGRDKKKLLKSLESEL